MLGAKTPKPFKHGWRVFYTAQHGDNVTFEIIPDPTAGPYNGGKDGPDDSESELDR